MNKRGVSDVVSTVLIILLVVAAIAVVGAIVLRTVNKAGPGVETSVICQQLQVSANKCSYTSGINPTVIVGRKDGQTAVSLTNLTFIFTKGINSENKYATVFPAALETKSYSFTGANSLGTGVSSPDSVQIAASIKGSDGKIVTCQIGQKVACTNAIVVPAPAALTVFLEGQVPTMAYVDWYTPQVFDTQPSNSIGVNKVEIEFKQSSSSTWAGFETYTNGGNPINAIDETYHREDISRSLTYDFRARFCVDSVCSPYTSLNGVTVQ